MEWIELPPSFSPYPYHLVIIWLKIISVALRKATTTGPHTRSLQSFSFKTAFNDTGTGSQIFFEPLPPPKKKKRKKRRNSMFLIQLWTKMEKALLTQMWYLLPLAIAKTAIAASYPRMPIVQITRCTSSSLWWRWKWCQAIMITTLFMMLVMLTIGMTRMLSEQLIECPSSE